MDDDGDNTRDSDDTMREVELERLRVLLGDNNIEKSDEGFMNSVLLHVWYTMDPYEFKVPKPPDDLV